MQKFIWTCWFQGRASAPPLVETCISSWERANPDWQLRCLDAGSIEKFVPIRDYIDPERQALTAASLSDVVRLLLLREFGGVWVDATLLCNRPLDEWLPPLMGGGFFGFSNPAPDRPLSSWFLSADCDNHLVAAWTRRMIEFWAPRRSSDDYFWLHHLFRDMCETDPDAARAWARVPKITADGPHALQTGSRMLGPAAEAQAAVDAVSAAARQPIASGGASVQGLRRSLPCRSRSRKGGQSHSK